MYDWKSKNGNAVKEVRDIVETENLRIRQCSDNRYLWHCSESGNYLVAFYDEDGTSVDIEYIPLNNPAPSHEAKIVIQSRDNPPSLNLESKITKTLEEARMYEVISNKLDDTARYHKFLCFQRE